MMSKGKKSNKEDYKAIAWVLGWMMVSSTEMMNIKTRMGQGVLVEQIENKILVSDIWFEMLIKH